MATISWIKIILTCAFLLGCILITAFTLKFIWLLYKSSPDEIVGIYNQYFKNDNHRGIESVLYQLFFISIFMLIIVTIFSIAFSDGIIPSSLYTILQSIFTGYIVSYLFFFLNVVLPSANVKQENLQNINIKLHGIVYSRDKVIGAFDSDGKMIDTTLYETFIQEISYLKDDFSELKAIFTIMNDNESISYVLELERVFTYNIEIVEKNLTARTNPSELRARSNAFLRKLARKYNDPRTHPHDSVFQFLHD
jgi:hypothetical protein